MYNSMCANVYNYVLFFILFSLSAQFALPHFSRIRRIADAIYFSLCANSIFVEKKGWRSRYRQKKTPARKRVTDFHQLKKKPVTATQHLHTFPNEYLCILFFFIIILVDDLIFLSVCLLFDQIRNVKYCLYKENRSDRMKS